MATAAVSPSYAGSSESSNSGIWSWLTTVDHKRIGVLYLFTSLTWFFEFSSMWEVRRSVAMNAPVAAANPSHRPAL